ncbi:DUF4097 family beta strand repeat-containing protein [Listeria valentina]|uniref:DUF4097 family beta strand repeat-containing protein n=1 Tax=Listeria valentina TaxID=2705293 RepID=UPI0014319EDA|nr:DUF4097 family beta strand repeat-containing protein [Listeria valentina]
MKKWMIGIATSLLVLAALYFGAAYVFTQEKPAIEANYTSGKDLVIDMESAEVKVSEGNSDNIKVITQANYSYQNVVEKTKQTLRFKQGSDSRVVWQKIFPSNVKVAIEIPKNYSKKLVVKTESGAVDLSKMNLRNASIETQSGSLSGRKLTGSGHFETKSGEINTSFVKIGAPSKWKSESGAIQIKMLDDKDYTFDLKSDSGSIKAPKSELRINREHRKSSQSEKSSVQVDIQAQTKSGAIQFQ